ncbi:hypothetical protein ABZX65_26885 [Streptomyces sp. NPDC003300]|uniref:hypothetical protein n=1 Tax=unclassified Streptomyces TaxID=2593676 RepID=UPI0033BF6988
MNEVWIARYLTYHHPGEEEFPTLEEAIGFLAWGEEAGRLAGMAIIAPDGSVALDGERLDRALAERLDA